MRRWAGRQLADNVEFKTAKLSLNTQQLPALTNNTNTHSSPPVVDTAHRTARRGQGGAPTADLERAHNGALVTTAAAALSRLSPSVPPGVSRCPLGVSRCPLGYRDVLWGYRDVHGSCRLCSLHGRSHTRLPARSPT